MSAPRISDVKTKYVPGFDNPMTSFTLHQGSDDQNESSAKPKSWADMPFINTAGDGYGPHATTFGDIAAKIPSKPSLKKSCDKCGKCPDQTGPGYSVCASCKVSRYCSRECQTGHWKEHRTLCKIRTKRAEREVELEAKAIREKGPFVSNAALRKWYYDNVDIVDYAIIQTLELYNGRAQSLWRTHAVVFSLRGGKLGTSVTADEISFSDAEPVSFAHLARQDSLGLPPAFAKLVGAGTRIILIFLLNREDNLMAVESHDLPAEEEWLAMERDEMWRMHIRMRPITQSMAARANA